MFIAIQVTASGGTPTPTAKPATEAPAVTKAPVAANNLSAKVTLGTIAMAINENRRA